MQPLRETGSAFCAAGVAGGVDEAVSVSTLAGYPQVVALKPLAGQLTAKP
jgi:hypothetical protein